MLEWFAETTVVATALAGVAALAGRARTIGPTARHVLWLAVLLKFVTPPLVAWPWAVDWREVVRPAPEDTAEADLRPAMPAAPAFEGVAADPGPTIEVEPVAPSPVARVEVEWVLGAGWLLATGLLAAGQGWRIGRFRRRLRLGVPAPDDLVDEAGEIAARIGVRAPAILVVPGIGTPMLWCLGRPRLLLPASLVGAIGRDRWRGILAHELAHLRRGDHWVSRLELVAGLFWWWNPLYWLARARIDAEAELACDAWVVWALPDDRLAYAETLFDIGARMARSVTPSPALGAAGSGRFLERRLTMILREHVPCRVSPWGLLAAFLLLVLAVPSWSAVAPAGGPPSSLPAALAAAADSGILAPIADDDDDDEDDDEDARAKKAEARVKAAEARARAAEARAKAAEARAKGGLPKAKGKDDAEREGQVDRFGPEFEKKMEALGKELESQLGPGSAFEKKMKEMGEEIRKRVESEAQRPGQAETDAKQAQDRLEWAKKMKEKGYVSKDTLEREEANLKQAEARAQAEKRRAEQRAQAEKKRAEARAQAEKRKAEAEKRKVEAKAQAEKRKAEAKAQAEKKNAESKDRREARIAALEAQIRKLNEQLKALAAEDDKDDR